MEGVPVEDKVKLLSGNGSGYISKTFNEYPEMLKIKHIFAARLHPQTVCKFERLNRTAKSKFGLVLYRSPGELKTALKKFHSCYNNEKYHETLGDLRPANVYEARAEKIISKRKEV